MMNRHDYVPNGLNDYCLTCDLPRYSTVHEALQIQDIKLTWSADQPRANTLGDLIASGRIVRAG